ncbi:MAG: M48 family metallopeptidase [Clostridiales bacterium]|nr:M48 family metallopeptidase [Clostridiales bacterium]
MVKVLKTEQGEIPYVLTRKSVKNINFRLKADGILYISANRGVSEKYIRELISQNSSHFIEAAKKIAENREAKTQREAEGGFYFLGRKYDIEAVPSKENYCILKDRLYVYTSSEKNIDFLINKFLQEEIKKIYSETVDKIYSLVKADNTPYPAKISIKKMASRWGSCSPLKGNMSLNSELIKYPIGCLEYVVLHEFTHFHHKGHNRDFYACVEKYMKDYRDFVNILKKPYYEVSD